MSKIIIEGWRKKISGTADRSSRKNIVLKKRRVNGVPKRRRQGRDRN